MTVDRGRYERLGKANDAVTRSRDDNKSRHTATRWGVHSNWCDDPQFARTYVFCLLGL